MSQTTSEKITEGMVWTSGSSFAIKIIGIFYTITVLGNVSVSQYGLIELAMSIIPLMAIFNLAGLQPVVVADLVSLKTEEKHTQMRFLFSSFISIKILLGLTAFVVINIGIWLFSDTFFDLALQMAQVISLVFLAGPIRSITFLILTAAHKFKFLAEIRLVEELFKLALVFSLLVFFELGPLGVIIAFVVTDFATAFFALPISLKVGRSFFGGKLISRGVLSPTFVIRRHAKWSIFQSALHQFGQNIRPWIIQFFLGTQAVGIYAAATGLYQHTLSIAPITKVVSPIIPAFKTNLNKLTILINSAIRYQIASLVIVVTGSVVLLPYLIENFFPSYGGALLLFILLACSLVPDSFSRIYESVFHAFQLQKNLFVANIVKLGMTAVILPVAVWFLGIYGVAVELFLTTLLYAVTRYLVLRKKVPEYQIQIKDFFQVTEVDLILLERLKNFVPVFKKM